MTPLMVVATALSSLGSNKLRASLTLLGIVIGVSAVISLMSVGRGAQEAITSSIESLGTNLLFVRPGATTQGGIAGAQGSAATLTLEDAEALVDPIFAPSVLAVAPELRTGGQVVAGRENASTQIVGVTPEYETVRNFPVESGQVISDIHVENRSLVAVLGSQVADKLFDLRDPVGQFVRINGRQFTVIGVLESQGSGLQGLLDDQILVPITTVYYRLASERTAQGRQCSDYQCAGGKCR
jgi:putative ABC transport system permease protein